MTREELITDIIKNFRTQTKRSIGAKPQLFGGEKVEELADYIIGKRNLIDIEDLKKTMQEINWDRDKLIRERINLDEKIERLILERQKHVELIVKLTQTIHKP